MASFIPKKLNTAGKNTFFLFFLSLGLIVAAAVVVALFF